MTVMSNAESYSPIAALVNDLVRDRDRTGTGSTQKDKARSDGLILGTFKGRCDGVAAFLTDQRMQKYVKLGMLPVVDSFDVEKIIRRYFELIHEEEANLPDGQNRHAARKEIMEKLWGWLSDELNRLTFPADLEEAELDRRRAAILAGEEVPLEEDKEWLEAHIADLQEAADRVARLLQKPGRPIADSPQA